MVIQANIFCPFIYVAGFDPPEADENFPAPWGDNMSSSDSPLLVET